MDIMATQATTPQKSRAVARKKASSRARETVTSRPRMKVGMAMAREGPMRVRISVAMSRPSSAAPKSPTKSRADLVKKMVRVAFSRPAASPFQKRGAS